MAKAKKPAGAANANADNVLEVKGKDDAERNEKIANLALTPGVRHAAIASGFATGLIGGAHELPMPARVRVVGETMAKGLAGDKAMASQLLAAQAVVLDTMFTELAHRAASNLGRHMDAADRYAKLALKAQANCRATLEALAKLHQPREQIVKHVHVNEGGQAIVADQFHQHTGGKENGQSSEQPCATGTAGESAALPSPDPIGPAVPTSSGEGKAKVPHARRQRQRRTEGQP